MNDYSELFSAGFGIVQAQAPNSLGNSSRTSSYFSPK